jgi:hypothetical protein
MAHRSSSQLRMAATRQVQQIIGHNGNHIPPIHRTQSRALLQDAIKGSSTLRVEQAPSFRLAQETQRSFCTAVSAGRSNSLNGSASYSATRKQKSISTAFSASRSFSTSATPSTSSSTHLEPLTEKTVVSGTTYPKVREALLQSIKEAEFVSFDFELTGLHRTAESFTGVDQSYEAHAKGAKNFMPVQIGLCMAKRIGGGVRFQSYSSYQYYSLFIDTDRYYRLN